MLFCFCFVFVFVFIFLQRTHDVRPRTVDGRDAIPPGPVKTVPGEGMPIRTPPGRRGDLKIKFQVVFPTHLSVDQKRQLRSLL